MKAYDPFTDPECIEAFIEKRYQNFLLWCQEHEILPDFYCDVEVTYCEAHSDKFIEFGKQHLEDTADNEADRQNDEAKLDSDSD